MEKLLIDRLLVCLSGHILDPAEVLACTWENDRRRMMCVAYTKHVGIVFAPPTRRPIPRVDVVYLRVWHFLMVLKPAEDALSVIPCDSQLHVPLTPVLQVLFLLLLGGVGPSFRFS